jgi:hypothetical protein
MDSSIPPPAYRPSVVAVPTAPRPTPAPVRVRFSEVLAGGAQALVRGAEAAASVLPGGPIAAVALRGGSSVTSALTTPEGPGGTATAGTPATPADGGLESTMAQSEQMNLYYLQVQEQVNAQNRTYTALSNVLEVENNTAKSAISNIH